MATVWALSCDCQMKEDLERAYEPLLFLIELTDEQCTLCSRE